MSSKIFSMLEPAIYITEERDKRSLEKVLLETLYELYNFEAIILFEISKNIALNYVEPKISIPETACQDNLLNLFEGEYDEYRVEIDEWMSESINFCKPVIKVLENSTRAIFPLITNKNITGLLDIYGYQDNPEIESALIALTRIYGNFMALVQDNELDALTGLFNRKTFNLRLSEIFTNETCKVNNDDNGHWLAILDIDHFKRVNDSFGHLYGDEVLLLFSNIMQKTFSRKELLFRFGGEEFVVILCNQTESDAFAKFDEFRENVESFVFPRVGQVTVSVGMAKLYEGIHSTTLLEQTDKALYYAKEHGRNQVCNYHDLIRKGLLIEKEIDTDIDLF